MRATLRRTVRRCGRFAAALAVVAGTGVVSAVATTPGDARADHPLGAGGEYHALTPIRVLDTRNAINDVDQPGPKQLLPLAESRTFDVQLLGQGELPASSADVLAVAVNVTVAYPDQPGYVRVFGSTEPEGQSSLVNFRAGETVPNTAILRPGTDGKLTVRLVSEGGAGTAHVLIDVFGWFSTDGYESGGARLIPVEPSRIFDSRNAPVADPVRQGEVATVQVRGAGGVPAGDDVVGALVNVTGVNELPTSALTFVSVLPSVPSGKPQTSNLNLVPGQIKANLALVPIVDGNLYLFNETGDTHLLVDVVAYLQTGKDPATHAGRVVPLSSPFRVLDTRQAEFAAAPLGPGLAEDWSFADFVADVKIDGQWVGAQSAVIGNLTATGLQPRVAWEQVTTYLSAYPRPAVDTSPPPEVSNLNLVQGANVPNMALLKYNTDPQKPNQVRVYNYNGFVHYLYDATAVVLADPPA